MANVTNIQKPALKSTLPRSLYEYQLQGQWNWISFCFTCTRKSVYPKNYAKIGNFCFLLLTFPYLMVMLLLSHLTVCIFFYSYPHDLVTIYISIKTCSTLSKTWFSINMQIYCKHAIHQKKASMRYINRKLILKVIITDDVTLGGVHKIENNWQKR